MRVRRLIFAGLVGLIFTSSLAFAASSTRSGRILAFANRWIGTPYQWGGTSRAGIDCSAYLREMYKEVFGVDIPRTTNQQKDMGIPLALDPRNPSKTLEPGDLIFYFRRGSNTTTHVVAYAGNNTITHSMSGRGVVIDPIRKVFGRKIAARRFLVPKGQSGDDSEGFAAIPAAGPIRPIEIPCPPEITAKRHEVRTYLRQAISDWTVFGDRDICDFRALAEALRAKGGPTANSNAAKLEDHALWLESIESLKGEIGRGW